MKRLKNNEQRGSKPRCHWLTHGTREQVGRRLTELAQPWGTVSADDYWLPEGFCRRDEARLDKEPGLLPEAEHREALCDWWLEVPHSNANTPNFDIASTCKVGCEKGLLLVEAKAHAAELTKARKSLSAGASEDSRKNHKRIGKAIEEVNAALRADTGLCWQLSRDRCYQMSNRFAWSWKVATLEYPVILVYLGFLNAQEMGTPFASHDKWEALVKKHSRCLFPPGQVWGQRVRGRDRADFIPCICSRELRHDAPMADG